MSKIAPIDHKTVIKVFTKDGWAYSRTKGDHIMIFKKGFTRPIVIPAYKSISIDIIKSNLKTAKISRDKYIKLLDNVS